MRESIADNTNSKSDSAQVLPNTPEPSTPNGRDRDASGRFLPGNLAAVQNALRATQLPPELAHLPAEIDAWMANVAADEGGLDEIPARRRSLLEYRGRLHRRILQLDVQPFAMGLQ